MSASYVFTPYGNTLAYGRAELIHIRNANETNNSGLTSAIVRNYFGSNYNISANTWNSLFGGNNPVYEAPDLPLPNVSAIARLKETQTIVVDLLSIDVVMQIMLQMEKALNASTNAYKLFTNKYNSGTQESNTANTIRSIYKSHLYISHIDEKNYSNDFNALGIFLCFLKAVTILDLLGSLDVISVRTSSSETRISERFNRFSTTSGISL
jgi:hypothetical protein